DFDDETFRKAGEIYDVVIDRNLLPELETQRLQCTQLSPKATFGAGLVASEVACSFVCHRGAVPVDPHPYPLPARRRGTGRDCFCRITPPRPKCPEALPASVAGSPGRR